MSEHDTKPTPASGMPAAVAATSAAKPSVDEITAPKSEATVFILEAIEGLRGEVSTLRGEVTTRFERNEEATAQHATALKDIANQVALHSKHIADLTESQASVARSSAIAAELSAKALAGVSSAQDETRKMVSSAMTIQREMVAGAVVAALEPFGREVEALKVADKKTAETLEKQDEVLKSNTKKIDGIGASIGTIATGVAKLTRWQDHWVVKVILLAAVAAGGFYSASRAADKGKPTPALVAPASSH